MLSGKEAQGPHTVPGNVPAKLKLLGANLLLLGAGCTRKEQRQFIWDDENVSILNMVAVIQPCNLSTHTVHIGIAIYVNMTESFQREKQQIPLRGLSFLLFHFNTIENATHLSLHKKVPVFVHY